ncbi:uncharacterized protein LOC131855446 [Achroia grisella]|uniref:uncharacterized protein LOC131855446 n=1 Tax=Achroia grisella TaxID=688607 RepID=UPI0027D28EDA|nr:uncharacterized protein LOC131855446 [Achroia grisella]
MECLKYLIATDGSTRSDVGVLLLQLVAVLCALSPASSTIPQPRAPNFQYFERPNYRYPYYDENGRGKLLYGYGGPELFQYKSYSPLEGIH